VVLAAHPHLHDVDLLHRHHPQGEYWGGCTTSMPRAASSARRVGSS
jgi:hypothetical protein